MLRGAGELTLDLQEGLLSKGFSLKDATPYNVQFRGVKPVFLDFGSLELESGDGVWIAYNQLMVWDAGFRGLPGMFLSRLDGPPFEETVRALGWKPAWRYGAILDYLLPMALSKLDRPDHLVALCHHPFLSQGRARKEEGVRGRGSCEGRREAGARPRRQHRGLSPGGGGGRGTRGGGRGPRRGLLGRTLPAGTGGRGEYSAGASQRRESFEAAFADQWTVVDKLPFEDLDRKMDRCLYHFKRR